MKQQFFRRFVGRRVDPRVRRAAAGAAPCIAPMEALESRTLLAGVGIDEPGYNLSPSRSAQQDTEKLRAANRPAGKGKVRHDSPQPIAAVAAALPTNAQTYSGALNGKIVYTSAGHGWQWSTTLGRYATDRGDNLEIVEDFGNQEQMTMYADYLLRAGATVVPMRPVGRQLNEVVLDNDSPGVTFSGTWSNSTSAHRYDEDYGAVADAVAYRFAATTSSGESAVATYQPNIPQAGFYPVYTWALDSANRTTQLYRVNHTGGTTEIRVDHRKVGKGWVYLGTYHFNAGSSSAGNVQISNNSAIAGNVIADAIRFGNGMGDFTDSGAPGPSGYPREDENSYKWIRRGFGVGVNPDPIIGTGNVSAPSNMAEWMNSNSNPFGTAVYVGFHSNAAGGRGAVGLIDSDQFTPHQHDLALYTGRQINQDMQALNGQFEHNWSTRTTHTYTGGFGEIDLGSNAEMDATIIEVAFHDQAEDAQLIRDPKVRDQLARSTYEATLEYFDVWGGLSSPVSQPDEPTNARAIAGPAGITLSWSPPSARAGGPGAATGYRIYVSRDGYGFSNPINVGNVTSYTLPAADLDGGAYYFKVAALNAGGESPGSVVVGARKPPATGANRILVVNGFDRFDRTQNKRYAYAFTSDRLVDRVWSRYNNSFDYVVQAGEAIEAYTGPGGAVYGFDSAQNEQIASNVVNLANYDAVIWLAGEESTAQETFSTLEQSRVTTFLNGGGSLFVSGAEIGWDLEAQGGGAAFYNNTLKTDYIADDAGTYGVNGTAGSIFAGLSGITFDNGAAFNGGSGQFYDVDTADRINPTANAGATLAMTYANGGTGGAAIQHLDAVTGSRIVSFGFPFETIVSAPMRNAVMDRVLDFFTTGTGVVTGRAFQDNNDNGLQEAGEPSLPGVQIRLDLDGNSVFESHEPSVTTGASGNYAFNGAPVGTRRLLAGASGGTVGRGVHSPLVSVTEGGTASQDFRYFPTTFSGTNGNDNYYLRVSPDGARMEIHAAASPLATPTYSTAAGTIYELMFNLGGGDDSLTVDYTHGRPTQNDSFFNGGANATAAGDLLRVIGSTGNDRFSVSGGLVVTTAAGQAAHVMHPAQAERIRIEAGSGDDILDFNGGVPAPMTEAVSFAAGAGDNTLNINSGMFALATDAGDESDNLTINVNGSGSAVTFGATQHLAALNLAAGASAVMAPHGNRHLFTRGLGINATAVLDVADNDLIYDYDPTAASPFGFVWQAVRDGGGGTNGIISSTSTGDTVLAVVNNAQYGRSSWNGEQIDASTIIGKYTYYGDANLDGKVTGDDYVAIDSNLGRNPGASQWFQGDFNFDLNVTGDDYVSIDSNLGDGVGAPL